MNEKKVMVLIFGLVVLVAIIGLVLFYQSEKTGGFNVQLPVNIKAGKAVKRTPVKVSQDRVIVSREIKEDVKQEKIKATKSAYIDNCCIWKDTGMIFHISPPTVKHMNYPANKVGTDELFNKNDLEFATKPYFYDSNNLCVKGGTKEEEMAGTVLCIKSYKGIKMIPNAGLLCYENRWWLAGSVCGSMELGVPGAPLVPD